MNRTDSNHLRIWRPPPRPAAYRPLVWAARVTLATAMVLLGWGAATLDLPAWVRVVDVVVVADLFGTVFLGRPLLRGRRTP